MTVTRRILLTGCGLGVVGLLGRGSVTSGLETAAPHRYGAGGGLADHTTTLRGFLDRHLDVLIEDGIYPISGPLRLRSGQTVRLSSGTVIRQLRAGQNAFIAVGCAGVSLLLNGGAIIGPGGYNGPVPWTGNQGQEGFRGIRFLGCTGSGVVGPGRVSNWANAAIDFTGGSNLRCQAVTIEGTHRFGGPLVPFANFQNGLYLVNDQAFGAADAVTVDSCDFSGMAQGILREALPGAPPPRVATTVSRCLFHDIPGQHGIYNQDGLFEVHNCRFRDLAGSAVKNQAGDAGRGLRTIRASGIYAERIGGSLFETAEVGSFGGWIEDIHLSGEARHAGFLASLNGRILDAQITVSGRDIVNNAVYVQGAGCRRVSIIVEAEAIEQDGVLITARDADLEIRAKIRDPNGARVLGGSGIRVSSPSARVVLIDPAVSDDRQRMMYGLFNDTSGSVVRVRGSIVATGAGDVAVRATGRIAEFPARATLRGARGPFIGQANIADPR